MATSNATYVQRGEALDYTNSTEAVILSLIHIFPAAAGGFDRLRMGGAIPHPGREDVRKPRPLAE